MRTDTRRVITWILGVSALLALALALADLATWPQLLVLGAATVITLRPRAGSMWSVGAAVLATLLLLLLSMIATVPIDAVPMRVVLSIVLAIATAGAIALGASGPPPPPVTRRGLSVVIPSLVGGAVFPAAAALAFVVPGAAALAWVMAGDSANNILFAREIIYRGGVGATAADNPVPLPSALMAFAMSAGRDRVAPPGLLEHDLTSFVLVWAGAIGASAVLCGLVAGMIVRSVGAPARVIAIAATAGSLLPLSWMFTTYPMDYGFFNTHVTLVITLAAVLLVLSDRHPAATVGLLAVASTVLLAVWSPLVLVPLSLAVVVLLRSWREVLGTRGIPLLVLVLGVAQAAAYGALIVLPGLLRMSGFLSAPGGAVGFPKPMLPVLALAVVGLAAIAAGRLRSMLVAVALALATASAIGLAALVVIARFDWTYYPLKFAWLAALILIVVGLGAGVGAAWRLVSADGTARPSIATAVVVVAATVSIGAIHLAPATVMPGALDPLRKVLGGNALGEGDTVAREILEYANPEQSTFLWHSGDPFEWSVNFWVLQMRSDSMSENVDLRYAAYGFYDADDIHELCRIVDLIGPGTIVRTADATVPQQVAETCNGVAMEIVVEP